MTIRIRLTVLYGALFLLAGAVLLGVTYLLVQQTLAEWPCNKGGSVLPPGTHRPDRVW